MSPHSPRPSRRLSLRIVRSPDSVRQTAGAGIVSFREAKISCQNVSDRFKSKQSASFSMMNCWRACGTALKTRRINSCGDALKAS